MASRLKRREVSPTGGGSDREVAAYLGMLSPESRRLTNALRRLVRRAAPTARETVLWGGLSYHLAFLGGRVKGAVCQISVRGDRVELGFIHGVLLPDPSHLLRGTGKSKRTVPVESIETPSRQALLDLVRDAVRIRP